MSHIFTKTLGAFTEISDRAYPPYVNVSHDFTVDMVVITMRADPGEINIANIGDPVDMVPHPGDTTQMLMTADEFAQMMGEIIANCDDDIKERIIKAALRTE